MASHTRDVAALDDGLEPGDPLARRLAATARAAASLTEEMDFTFLYDTSKDLFAIGYRPQDGTLDSGHYDLLASEARLASFVAIARGDVPVEHWFHLGRPLSPVGRGSALLSWSGSMFEYLMPDLVLEAPSGSLLEHTNRLAVRRQIQYGEERGVPWGISEAAYNARDVQFTYQYSNFGVIGLGLKRGLAEDLVVAPYATALAAMFDPAAASENFQRLASVGALGRYGFYESIDYTTSRLPEGVELEVVKAYMAHHQGMTIVALANVLLEAPMRRRFRAEPIVQATELLLQERTPVTVAVARTPSEDARAHLQVVDEVPAVLRRFRSPHDPTPRTHLLSNGRYSVMVTAAGSGYSRWHGLDVTRWREDTTRDPWGTYFFLADAQSGRVWSAGYQPAGVEPDSYEAVYAEDCVEIHRTDGPIATSLRIVVSTEDDAEIRQVSLTNRGPRPREIEVTSYAEVVLASEAADAAASRLFEPLRPDGVRPVARGAARRAPAARSGRARLGGAGPDGAGGDGRHRAVRDRPGALSRPRAKHPQPHLDRGAPAALEHRRHRSRPGLQSASPAGRRSRSDGARASGHGRRRLAGRGAFARRQVPGSLDIRPRVEPRLDAGAGPTASSRDHRRRGAPLPAGGVADPLLRRGHARSGRDAPSQPERPFRLLESRDLRRHPHRARPDRPGRGPGDRATAPARPRVLAHEGLSASTS